jgi:hypothetical protein
VSENRELVRISELEIEELKGAWRKLHNEVHNLYSSPNRPIIRTIKSRMIKWAGHSARKGEGRNAYPISVEESEENSPLGTPRRRWEDNIKMDLK